MDLKYTDEMPELAEDVQYLVERMEIKYGSKKNEAATVLVNALGVYLGRNLAMAQMSDVANAIGKYQHTLLVSTIKIYEDQLLAEIFPRNTDGEAKD